ncbi:hypothetical protein KKZ87_01930 [Enterobacter cloacae]|uniref:hypothetical protein n=1 Tax=Enterobacter cloacae TaxID=550 RepID=UPI001BDF1A0B|nr:hypothetical protein [Enterobacter cloacae]MBT1833582.1 hypothetical protein [Enterobacter cloacae]
MSIDKQAREELRKRYTPPEIPNCSICGASLSIQRCGGGEPTVYACDGYEADPENPGMVHRAAGRGIADKHYEESRYIDWRKGGDLDVIALLDELEAAEKLNADYRARLDRLERKCDHQNSVYWDASNVKRCARCGISVVAGIRIHSEDQPMTFTKEQLQQIIETDHVQCGEASSLARIALASLEAEPVSEFYHEARWGWYEISEGDKVPERARIPLYKVPPAPVPVPAAMEMDDDFDSAFEHGKAVGWNACRAAMLQGSDGTLTNEGTITATQFKPVADLYGLTSPTGGETSFTFDAVEARDFIDGGWSCQEYVELERFQEAVSGNSPVIPDGFCIMPKKLTAENGGKGALSGEFHVTNRIVCQSCGGEGCEDCNDEGGWDAEIPVSWDTIKRIHEAAVEACSLPAAPQQEVKP